MMADPAATSIRAHEPLHSPKLPSELADFEPPLSVFPPPRFRALQWVQSDPTETRRETPEMARDVEWAQAEIALETGQPAERGDFGGPACCLSDPV